MEYGNVDFFDQYKNAQKMLNCFNHENVTLTNKI